MVGVPIGCLSVGRRSLRRRQSVDAARTGVWPLRGEHQPRARPARRTRGDPPRRRDRPAPRPVRSSMTNVATPPRRLMLICGSMRSGSTNEALLRTVASLLPDDVVADLYDGMGLLPHFNPDDDHDPLPARVADLRHRIATANAVLFSTPEYAGAMPGSLKNLLDWTVGGVEVSDKPAAWINISTAPAGATDTHESLSTVL